MASEWLAGACFAAVLVAWKGSFRGGEENRTEASVCADLMALFLNLAGCPFEFLSTD